MAVKIEHFFDPATFTLSYLIIDSATNKAAVVDPILDYDIYSGQVTTVNVDKLLTTAHLLNADIEWVLETHAHADHLSAAQYIKKHTGAMVGIGDGIREVQKTFKDFFNFKYSIRVDGSQFNRLFKDEDILELGDTHIRVMHTPGHTSDSIVYLVEDNAFVGDTLFMPDYGTARCDFPGGDARKLYQSIERIHSLPEKTKLHMCHDYLPNGRDLKFSITVEESRRDNIHLKNVDQDEFVRIREERDKGLSIPKLMYPAIQINVRAGLLPEPEDNNTRYLKIPIRKN